MVEWVKNYLTEVLFLMELFGAQSALLHKKYHKTVVKTHLDFIKAGAEVIVTNSFGSRKRRLIENNLSHKLKV